MKIARAFIFFCCLFNLPAFAEAVSYKEVKSLSLIQEFATKKDWHVAAYQPEGALSPDDDPRFGDVPAKLCFRHDNNEMNMRCTLITSVSPNSKLIYHYQTVSELSIVAKPHLIKFVAEYSGGASGKLVQISFWRYDQGLDTFEPDGLISLTEQGEYRLFDTDGRQDFLVTADAQWRADETHFSPHQFYIQIYQYQSPGGYAKLLGYITPSKYPSLDDADKIDVISHELAEIRKRLTD